MTPEPEHDGRNSDSVRMYRRVEAAKKSGGWGIIKLIGIALVLAISTSLFYQWHTTRQQQQQKTDQLVEQYQRLEIQLQQDVSVGQLRQAGRTLQNLQADLQRVDITPEQKNRVAQQRNPAIHAFLDRSSATMQDLSLMDPSEYLAIAVQMHEFLQTREQYDIPEQLAGRARKRIQHALEEGARQVRTLVERGPQLSTLTRARRYVDLMAQASPPSSQNTYRRIETQLSQRIRQLRAATQGQNGSPSTQGQQKGMLGEANAAVAANQRKLYVQKLQPSVATSEQIDSLYLEGPQGRRLVARGSAVAQEMISWFLGSREVRSQLVGLGFQEFVAHGREGSVGFDIRRQKVLFERGGAQAPRSPEDWQQEIQKAFPGWADSTGGRR